MSSRNNTTSSTTSTHSSSSSSRSTNALENHKYHASMNEYTTVYGVDPKIWKRCDVKRSTSKAWKDKTKDSACSSNPSEFRHYECYTEHNSHRVCPNHRDLYHRMKDCPGIHTSLPSNCGIVGVADVIHTYTADVYPEEAEEQNQVRQQ